ncbi:hypothetical protein DIZ81_05265 [Legionella taurinensis]|uniref:tRNA-guanine(15) transglycosylase-like domain-containing protein n=1 Tax=Legionella taurinensis TaxID=70611 RepID=A0AB38N4J3_9GAMM|nr:hypothetical protein [Legionella taurinensis]MDX1837324.1 hypothetical protein [Legionella taurinensis]PUT40680.1 hypothetical protein DB744_05265 [Legionella taurinensis]PUT44102.1 hypothetical protein DB746_03665 [Legionella taurinensis]PUT47403.1 hypothetical protein DB743_01835 [Legionella taurinensis]PUT48542.1 hypothetical protein DB745_03665 [Legionella taurinensis]
MPTTPRLIPVLTSHAGSCLTLDNWQQAGISLAALYLDALLMKPGLDFLKSSGGLKSYYPWSGELVLNASTLTEDKAGHYRVRSHYDGEIIQLDAAGILALLIALKPDYVVLSPSLADYCERLKPEWQGIRLLSEEEGTYHYRNRLDAFLAAESIAGLIEADFPANDAVNGRVYDQGQVMDLSDSQYSQDFTVLSAGCACPVCRQNYTRAYFHHLLQHTPLLAQRLLIQHNVHYCQNQ